MNAHAAIQILQVIVVVYLVVWVFAWLDNDA
jgi:hypothetical protein